MEKSRLIDLYLKNNDELKLLHNDLMYAEQDLAKYRLDTIELCKNTEEDCMIQGFSRDEAEKYSMAVYDSRMNDYDYTEVERLRDLKTKHLELKEVYEMAIKYMSGEVFNETTGNE